MAHPLFNNFTHLYSVSKTLRFELQPQGRTLEHIEAKGLLQQDEQRAEHYKKIKKIIDEYHKAYIDKALQHLQLQHLDAFAELYYRRTKTEADKKALKELQKKLRRQIADALTQNPDADLRQQFERMFKEELIKQDLLQFETEPEKQAIIKEFEKFTTYFTGFHENRKNMYSEGEEKTAIAYRLVHENLPRFLDNVRVYELLTEKHPQLNLDAVNNLLQQLLPGTTLQQVFDVAFFNRLLTQKGIDAFNQLIGGKTEAEGGKEKVRGLNEYSNLYRQQNNLKPREVPLFKPLYKQILSDRSSISFLPEQFTDSRELLDAVSAFYHHELKHYDAPEQEREQKDVLRRLQQLLQQMNEYDRNRIYLRNNEDLTTLSRTVFHNWAFIKQALEHYYDTVVAAGNTPATVKKVKKNTKAATQREKWLKQAAFPVALLDDAISLYAQAADDYREWADTQQPVTQYLQQLGAVNGQPSLLHEVETTYAALQNLLQTHYTGDLRQDKAAVQPLKAFLDAVLQLNRFITTLLPDKTEQNADEGFYANLEPLADSLAKIVPLYNKTRNYVTQKPYSTQKFKLNFENSTLLNGWDVNKEKDNSCVLLRKNGNYYLGIMDKRHRNVFVQWPEVQPGEAVYEKMMYKYLPGPNKMLPKVFFSKSNAAVFNPPSDLLAAYKEKTHIKGDAFKKEDMYRLIDFFKESINKHEDWKHFGFRFDATTAYEDMSDFYRQIANQGYSVSFKDVPQRYVDQLVEEGKLYLFKIYNKDFSPYSKGRPNLHTLYWKALFEPANLQNVVYKLSGEAEVFFRKKSINYSKEVLERGHHGEALKDKFQYPIISNKRYACDKFQFHVPIQMNFKADSDVRVNNRVLELLQHHPDIKVIGIDRGERHLLYVTLIDSNGTIIPGGQFSLNTIEESYGNKTFTKPYQQILANKAAQRQQARRSWDTIEGIKNLKAGYLSQVVHRIARLVVEQGAVVVLEDLNAGFKRGRFKIEKQVYQNFEKMLIQKLNYLLLKDRQPNEPGGLYKAYQLTEAFESFQKLGKQSGVLFYVPAAYTSKIDPCTGFVNLFTVTYENVAQAQQFFKSFTGIRFNPEKAWFEFSFDYNNFGNVPEGTRSVWTVCSTPGTRYAWNSAADTLNGRGAYEPHDVTAELEDVLAKAGIVYGTGENLVEAIAAQTSASFFKNLIFLFRLLVQLRYTNGQEGAEGKDYILSPIVLPDGRYFNSETAPATLPANADANGAYHIARKGLCLLQKIRSQIAAGEKVQLALSNAEWLAFVQQNPVC